MLSFLFFHTFSWVFSLGFGLGSSKVHTEVKFNLLTRQLFKEKMFPLQTSGRLEGLELSIVENAKILQKDEIMYQVYLVASSITTRAKTIQE